MLKLIATIFSLFIMSNVFSTDDNTSYTTKYDGLEVDKLLANPRLIKAYINCALHAGPCTRESNLIKKFVPEALENDCAKCSERQRYAAKRIINYLIQNETEAFLELAKLLDPQGKYKEKYNKEAEEFGIKLPY